MPGQPLYVTTLQSDPTSAFHKFMIVAFQESTLVLAVSNDKVSQVTDSGFVTTEQTVHATMLEGGIFIQVT
jgi:hypothetical protein